MKQRPRFWIRLACVGLAVSVCALPNAPLKADTPPGFLERFALATDRSKALEELVPGSGEHFYFNALHAQNTGDVARFSEWIKRWEERQPG